MSDLPLNIILVLQKLFALKDLNHLMVYDKLPSSAVRRRNRFKFADDVIQV